MFNNNYKAINVNSVSDCKLDLYSIAGNARNNGTRSMITASYAEIRVGTSDEAGLPSDLDLKARVDLTKVSSSVTLPANFGCDYEYLLTTTLQNDTSASVTVKELGFFSNYSNNLYLMDRQILDTPVTIAPGEKYTFTYQIS